ncbi:MAG: hypothetical protein WCR55_09865 [Lentisphaerota bacterium]
MLDKLFATLIGGIVFYAGLKLGEKIYKKASPHLASMWEECQKEMKEEEEAKKAR